MWLCHSIKRWIYFSNPINLGGICDCFGRSKHYAFRGQMVRSLSASTRVFWNVCFGHAITKTQNPCCVKPKWHGETMNGVWLAAPVKWWWMAISDGCSPSEHLSAVSRETLRESYPTAFNQPTTMWETIINYFSKPLGFGVVWLYCSR